MRFLPRFHGCNYRVIHSRLNMEIGLEESLTLLEKEPIFSRRKMFPLPLLPLCHFGLQWL